MSDDFCLIHGRDHMTRERIPECKLCANEAMLAASPPAPSVGDVVREYWDGPPSLTTEANLLAWTDEIARRMAAALGVSEANRTMWHDLAQERLGEMQRLESKVTAQAAEVERLTGELADIRSSEQMTFDIAARLLKERDAALTVARSASGYLMNARIDLETGAPKKTAIKTIEGGIAMIREALLLHALAALPSPPVTKIKGEG